MSGHIPFHGALYSSELPSMRPRLSKDEFVIWKRDKQLRNVKRGNQEWQAYVTTQRVRQSDEHSSKRKRDEEEKATEEGPERLQELRIKRKKREEEQREYLAQKAKRDRRRHLRQQCLATRRPTTRAFFVLGRHTHMELNLKRRNTVTIHTKSLEGQNITLDKDMAAFTGHGNLSVYIYSHS